MIKPIFLEQIEYSEQGFGYTTNYFQLNECFSLENVISYGLFDTSLRSLAAQETFTQNTEYGYLKGLFISERLQRNDFLFIPSKGIIYYLEGFSDSEREWGTDKLLFKNLLTNFNEQTEDSLFDCYLINKEWFKQDDPKVRGDREFVLYDFYFIIIWVNKNDPSKLYISEWSAD